MNKSIDPQFLRNYEELYSVLIGLVQLVRGDDGSIYDTMNPYCRPEMKKALKTLAVLQGLKEEDYLSANVPQKEKK